MSKIIKKYLAVIKNVLSLTYQNKHTMKKQTVKILGQTVTVGSKLHKELLAQIKHLNDLAKSEN
jgi:hypothetical protein